MDDSEFTDFTSFESAPTEKPNTENSSTISTISSYNFEDISEASFKDILNSMFEIPLKEPSTHPSLMRLSFSANLPVPKNPIKINWASSEIVSLLCNDYPGNGPLSDIDSQRDDSTTVYSNTQEYTNSKNVITSAITENNVITTAVENISQVESQPHFDSSSKIQPHSELISSPSEEVFGDFQSFSSADDSLTTHPVEKTSDAIKDSNYIMSSASSNKDLSFGITAVSISEPPLLQSTTVSDSVSEPPQSSLAITNTDNTKLIKESIITNNDNEGRHSFFEVKRKRIEEEKPKKNSMTSRTEGTNSSSLGKSLPIPQIPITSASDGSLTPLKRIQK